MDMREERAGQSRKRLTARDWADAALAAIGERGLAGVAVEPLAARLGTTKGSFYWHFANRDALIEAALAAEDPLEVLLLATADDPHVAPVLQRVTERRIGYVAHLFEELGLPPEEARRRGLLAYTSYLGHAQLSHAVPESLPVGAERRGYLDSVMDNLLRRG